MTHETIDLTVMAARSNRMLVSDPLEIELLRLFRQLPSSATKAGVLAGIEDILERCDEPSPDPQPCKSRARVKPGRLSTSVRRGCDRAH
jgi:hypothetical protein